MGVTYKLKEEVVQYIINQRKNDSLSSCRQLAESVFEKFGLRLSKSSVHDVLKESGIITPRGRKPTNKFEIPQEKKKQIQSSLSEVKLLSETAIPDVIASPKGEAIPEKATNSVEIASSQKALLAMTQPCNVEETGNIDALPEGIEVSEEYEGAGKVFYNAVLWDLGIFVEDNIKEEDWKYYLTYCKGVKVVLEGNRSFFIDLPLPIERCIRETVDGLVNNIRPMKVGNVSDKELFNKAMESKDGFKITNIVIVDQKDHDVVSFDNIVELKRSYSTENMLFVESKQKNRQLRALEIFFSPDSNLDLIESIYNIKGTDSITKDSLLVSLFIEDSFKGKSILQEAVEKLNRMFLRDDQDRLVRVQVN